MIEITSQMNISHDSSVQLLCSFRRKESEIHDMIEIT
jgi:hypothetical protein